VPTTDLGRFAGIGAIEARMNDTQYDFTRRSLFSDQVDDTHLMALTQAGADDATRDRTQGQFKTPSLRNVNKTAPYMHDGAYQTLWDVVNHYNFGGTTGPYSGAKDPALSPLLLTDAELGDLVEFLRALDDGDVLETHDFDQSDGDTQGLLGPPAGPASTP
jgi:cytochrome c peroxidase